MNRPSRLIITVSDNSTSVATYQLTTQRLVDTGLVECILKRRRRQQRQVMRSTLARHRKRQLQQVAQPPSGVQELSVVVALAGATSASLGSQASSDSAVNDVVRVLRNAHNSVYHRGA